MSKYLGPIHFMLYGKIQIEEDMVEKIANLAKNNGWKVSLEELNDQVGSVERAPLDTVINTDNIHGWLQEQVSIVESRFAYLVSKLLLEDASRKDILADTMFELGKENWIKYKNGEFGDDNSPIENLTPEDIYLMMNKTFLDGMPCDRANEIIEKDDEKLVWHLRLDVHEEFWKYGIPVEVYHELRKSWLDGFLQDASIELNEVDVKTYQLMRRR